MSAPRGAEGSKVMDKKTLAMAHENPIAAAIRRAIGATDTECIGVVTPQFERGPGEPTPGPAPADFAAFESLRGCPETMLRSLGMGVWGRQERADGTEFGPVLCLFPGEWYKHIPAGLEVVDINFQRDKFVPGETDNDIRFGCLAYGVLSAEGSGVT